MPNCKICGKPVQSAPVHHPECWEKEVEAMAEIFCDNYCRHPLEHTNEDELQEQHCGCCPLIKVLNLGL